MNKPNPNQALEPVVNRFADMMIHTTRYAFFGLSRLAKDAGVSPSALSELLRGKSNPSFVTVIRITSALEKELGRRIDPRNLIAEGGNFIHPYICEVAGCRGCLPNSATDEFGDRTPMFQGVRPGQWVTSAYPGGFEKGGANG